MTVGVIPAPLDPPWRGDGGDTGLGCRWGVEALGLGVGFSPGGLLTSWGSCVASRGRGLRNLAGEIFWPPNQSLPASWPVPLPSAVTLGLGCHSLVTMTTYSVSGTKILQHDTFRLPGEDARVVAEGATPEIASKLLKLIELDQSARVRGFREGLGEELDVLAQLLGNLMEVMRGPCGEQGAAKEIRRLVGEIQAGGRILMMK